MPGLASATGLISARVKPIRRRKSKKIQLCGEAKPAPMTLRPFAGLYNPFACGCSVLCNHPADRRAKETLRQAKTTWASDRKTIRSYSPEEEETTKITVTCESGAVPEELFRKYTETDSRPLSPIHGSTDFHGTMRPTLVLDLRAESKPQDTETLSWHQLALEPFPSPRRPEVSRPIPTVHHSPAQIPIVIQQPSIKDPTPDVTTEADDESKSEEEPSPMRRRGKKLKKRKNRRCSTYGQSTEVRDLLEPAETQVSQVNGASRRNSVLQSEESRAASNAAPMEHLKATPEQEFTSSFIREDLLKHLSRELNVQAVETEFSTKRRVALEEAFKLKSPRPLGQTLQPPPHQIPKVFSRQHARFQLLNAQQLAELKPLDYLAKHAFASKSRRTIYFRAFNRYYEETLQEQRFILPRDVDAALAEVMGQPLTDEQQERLHFYTEEIRKPMDFRTFSGLCSIVERLLAPLPSRDDDPPDWLEITDFGSLDRKLQTVEVHPKLAIMLREIRDR